MDSSLGSILLLVIASGLFSASEIALTSLSQAKVLSIKEDGKFASSAIVRLKNTPQKVLVSILVGNQVVNIFATFLATLLGIRWLGEGSIALYIATFTILFVLFGSILPKTFALGFPEPFARVIAYPLLVFVLLTRPVIWFFELIINFFAFILKIKSDKLNLTTEREIEAMIDIGAEEGVLEEGQDVFLKHVLRFGETQLKEVMIPLKKIKAINIDIERSELIEFLDESHHTEFPVYVGDINTIRGTISLHELTQVLRSSRAKHPLKNQRYTQAVVVPKTSTFIQLFKVLSEKKSRIAIVIDQYGQTVGLATLASIMEQITGISAKQSGSQPTIKKIKTNLWELDGEVRVEQINEVLGVILNHPVNKVMSLVILEELKRFPEVDEVVRVGGIDIRITRMEKNVVKKLEISKARKAK